MSCPCDKASELTLPCIDAGLADLPRQIAGFSEFRSVLLSDLRSYAALHDWRARNEDDLGVMLLEMWAYVCDVLAFYDAAIVNENYVRTAKLRPSLRKLTGMLGYIPLPAVSSSALLTAQGKGRRTVTLQPGTPFRSEAFDGEAPQVFELDYETLIHPLNNIWQLEPQRPVTIGAGDGIGGTHTYMLLKQENARLIKKDPVLIKSNDASSHRSVHTISKREEVIGDDGESYIRIDLDPFLAMSAVIELEDIAISKPAQNAGLWTMGSSPASVINKTDTSQLILNGIYRQIKAGQYVLISKNDEYRWFKLLKVKETMMDVTTGGKFDVTDSEGDTATLDVPAFPAPATELYLDVSLNNENRRQSETTWTNSHNSELVVHYAFTDVGEPTLEKEKNFSSESTLMAGTANAKSIEEPADGSSPAEFILQDINGAGYKALGGIDYNSGELDVEVTGWDKELTPPVNVYGNLLQVGRGESVENEALGSGDASRAGQTFTLKKNPLTYISTPVADDERGVTTTLQVRVDGVLWQETASFYGVGPEDEVYIVRQNDEHETLIIFGDGIRGRRLPTGTGNIAADYRHGAGEAAPPANAITQPAKPVKGLSSVNNPFPASGGADAEDAEGIREYAPRSALILGRAVSIHDFVAVTAGLPGVRAVHAEWRWSGKRQRPVIQIRYIGDSDSENISTSLRNLADPAVALEAVQAKAQPLTLSFDIEIDSAYVEDDVLADIRIALLDGKTGILAPERIGIRQPLYRSRLFAFILSIPGTVAVTDIQWNEAVFDAIAIKPDTGDYFDVESGALILNGKEDFNG